MVTVVVPWRSDPHRAAAWRWVRTRYEQTGWPVVEGACPDGPWIKALAVADALQRVETDRVVIADADVWCDGVPAAVDALDTHGWAVPHRTVLRLSQAATVDVLTGGEFRPDDLDEPPYRGYTGGGLVVLPTELARAVPLDPRFRGWGQEDVSWGHALTVVAGRPWRGTAHLWHLWHPPQPRDSRRVGNPDGHALWHRYLAARTPGAVLDLIGEAWPSVSP